MKCWDRLVRIKNSIESLGGQRNEKKGCKLSYMGGGTFVDGVRRLFQRRGPSLSVTSTSSNTHENHLTPFEQNKKEREQKLRIEEDFDLSGLKLIKVPKRINFAVSSSSSSMDHQKKVPPFLSFPNLLFVLGFCRSVC